MTVSGSLRRGCSARAAATRQTMRSSEYERNWGKPSSAGPSSWPMTWVRNPSLRV